MKQSTYPYVLDHKDNKYKNVNEMCEAYGIRSIDFRDKLQYGMSLEDALTKNISDFEGNIFFTIKDMCDYWEIKKPLFFTLKDKGENDRTIIITQSNKIKRENKAIIKRNKMIEKENKIKERQNMSKVENLNKKKEVPIENVNNNKRTWKNTLIVDHEGNIFKTLPDMCKHWGISESCYYERKRRNMSLEQILTYRPDFRSTDHLGNEYRTKSEMCNHYGVQIATYNSRIKAGWTVEEALLGK